MNHSDYNHELNNIKYVAIQKKKHVKLSYCHAKIHKSTSSFCKPNCKISCRTNNTLKNHKFNKKLNKNTYTYSLVLTVYYLSCSKILQTPNCLNVYYIFFKKYRCSKHTSHMQIFNSHPKYIKNKNNLPVLYIKTSKNSSSLYNTIIHRLYTII